MTTPADSDVQIGLGDIDSRFSAELLITSDINLDTQPKVTHNLEGFTPQDYLIVRGLPRAEPYRGAKIETKGGVGNYTKVTAPLRPMDVDLDAWARYLPGAEHLANPFNGQRGWWPVGSNRETGTPHMRLQTIDPAAPGSQGAYSGLSPQLDLDYRYQGYERAMQRPAMVFDGKGAAPISSAGLTGSSTIAITAVFRPSPLDFYGIFTMYEGNGGDSLNVRYHRGRVVLSFDRTQVLRHQTHKPANYPVIMLFALDVEADVGRMYCLDQNRTTRTFSMEDLDYVALTGVVGAMGQGNGEDPWRNGAEMDLLELDIWEGALSFAQMEEKANLLSLVYGVTA